jgi:dihydrofolate reductase
MTKPKISIIVAAGRDREGRYVIGANNELLWRIKDDLARFKSLTLGHPIVIGRKTFASIVAALGKPLPGRTNIVVTRDPSYAFDGAMTARSLEAAIKIAASLDQTEVFIGGGGEIYREALPLVDRIYLTLIDDVRDGDTFFPDYTEGFTTVVSRERRLDQGSGLAYEWIDLER